tara:strand:- start:5402 stop:7162 length:1761 start_codon:yes stop_codon:yes gene_type:complete
MADTWDIEGVTSSQGTPVNVDNSSDWINYEIDPNKDSTVAALEAKVNAEGIMSIINSNQSDWDKQWAMDQMRGRMYQAGEGLLGQASQVIEPWLQTYSDNDLGRRMGESYEDFLDRQYSDIRLAADYGLSKRPPNWIQRTSEFFPGYFSETGMENYRTLEEVLEEVRESIAGADKERTASTIELPGGKIVDGELILDESPEAWADFLNLKPDTKKDRDKVEEIAESIALGVASADEVLPETPAGTTDIFDINTGEWSQVKTEEEEIGELINQLSRPRVKENQLRREIAERDIQAAIRRDMVEQPSPLVASVAPNVLNVDLNKAIEDLTRQAELSAAIEEETQGIGTSPLAPEYSDIFQERFSDFPGVRGINAVGTQFGPNWDESAGVVDEVVVDEGVPVESAGTVAEEFWPGAGMTAEQSRERTRELNEAEYQRTLREIEALKQGEVAAQETIAESNNIFEGLSQELIDAIQADPALMDQYLASREEILARLATGPSPTPGGFTTRTPYVDQIKTHEDWYPGGQAAAVGAGFWGPMALPWNPKYRDYKDAQRVFMGKEPGEKYWSDDWIRAFGWMTPEQINELVGY